MRLLRRLAAAQRTYLRQAETIQLLLWEIERMRLEHARSTRDLIEQFWICQEGGIDVREPLLNGLRDMRDEVARLEEHNT